MSPENLDRNRSLVVTSGLQSRPAALWYLSFWAPGQLLTDTQSFCPSPTHSAVSTVFLALCHVSDVSADEVCVSLCLANNFKQDIASRSWPSLSFTHSVLLLQLRGLSSLQIHSMFTS